MAVAESITLYGEPTCEDTEAVRERFNAIGVVYREVNIDADKGASDFVIYINNGFRSTPTIVFGQGKRKLILTEPTIEQLDEALRWAGHLAR
jgi:mycoredoxin